MGGFSIGYGISVSPRLAAFDPDALAYFTTAGITDNTAKTQINDFVVGIKDLGLWSSMVSWPLRSSQNAGTGTTAYSLGGLGTYNGTLFGSPIWNDDFTDFSSTSQYMSITGLSGITSTMFLMSVVRVGLETNGTLGLDINSNSLFNGQITNYMHTLTGSPNTVINSGIRTGSGGAFSGWDNLITGLSENDLGILFIGHNGSNQLFRWNETTQSRSISTTVGIGSQAMLNRRSDAFGPQNGKSDYSFCMICNGGVSDSNFQSIRSLYKSTLGQGLGLP